MPYHTSIVTMPGESVAGALYAPPTADAVVRDGSSQVPIDACPVGGRDSALLQQAAHLTNGLYHRPPRPDGLLQVSSMP
jgi:hypothetical protein